MQSFIQNVAQFDDSQKTLGAGISSYHQQLVHLFCLFFVLFLMHVPVMVFYSGYNYYNEQGGLLPLTLGNLGFSETHCMIESMAKA